MDEWKVGWHPQTDHHVFLERCLAQVREGAGGGGEGTGLSRRSLCSSLCSSPLTSSGLRNRHPPELLQAGGLQVPSGDHSGSVPRLGRVSWGRSLHHQASVVPLPQPSLGPGHPYLGSE